MNTLPNLNAAPIAPAAPAPARPAYQADPQPADQSFTQALAREVADRRAAATNDNQINQNAANAQNAQNAQSAQNAQNAQNTQNAQANPENGSRSADAKADGADASGKSKTKSKADSAAGDADKAASELLALVASVADSKLTPEQQAAAIPAVPVTAPTLSTGADAKTEDPAAAGKALAQTLPAAVDPKTGQSSGKQAAAAKTGAQFKVQADADPAAADGSARTSAAAKDDAKSLPQLSAAASANAAQAHAAGTAPGIDLQATATTQNDNAAFNPALHQIAAGTLQAPAAGDKLAPPVGSPAWDQALGQKVVWMAGNGQQSATLTLNPPDLGPMQVVINVNKTQADATFIASSPEVKQALEAAMPKLREMLDQAGIQLGQSNVSTGMPNQQQQAFNQPQHGGGSGQRGGNGAAAADGGRSVAAIAPASGGSGQGLVDTFV
jgi:flagellar hook-length control protein FliK